MRSIGIDPRSALILDRMMQNSTTDSGKIGGEWREWNTGMVVDMAYRCPALIEGEVARVLRSEEESCRYGPRLWESVCSCDESFAHNRVPHPHQKRLLDLSGSLETIPRVLRDNIPVFISERLAQ